MKAGSENPIYLRPRTVGRRLVHERKALPDKELGAGCPHFVRTRVRTRDQGEAAGRCYKALQNKELRWGFFAG
jgi:hypothetical protein